jgi:precorrin-3B synthase
MQLLELDDLRRGWCPTVYRPMETGDGLLVRVHPPSARLTPLQARAIATAARSCGNGLIDLSGRGNLQIRGIRPATHAELVKILSATGLDDATNRQRCIVSPLAGLDPAEFIDAARLADEIDAALGTADSAEDIPPKFAVVVDGGGLPLDDVEADVRLIAIDAACVAVALASPVGDVWIGTCLQAETPSAIVSIVSAFAVARRAGNQARRMRDLSPRARQRIAGSVRLPPSSPPATRPPIPCMGAISMGGGRMAVGLGLPFGRLDADHLERLAAWSLQFGAGELHLSPWRSVLIPGVAETKVPTLLALAADAGLIVAESDPRRAIAACPGAPACARGSVSTHTDATRLAEAAPHLLEGATVHVSGCTKGCARRAPADLTLVGEDGAYAVVVRGATRDRPAAHMALGTILDRLKLLESEGPLATLSTERLAQVFEKP